MHNVCQLAVKLDSSQTMMTPLRIFANLFVIFFLTFWSNVEGFGSGNLPGAVCEDMVPGRKQSQHGENEVSQKDDLDPPFLVTATKLDDKQFIIGM